MRILFLISGLRAPSSRFRVLQFLPRLHAHGIDCEVLASVPPKYERVRGLGWRGTAAARRAIWAARWVAHCRKRYDVLVVEREVLAENYLGFERRFRRLAPRMVLDVDDAIYLHRPQKLAALTEMVDHVVVGNSLLAEWFAPRCRALTIIPTCVDLARYPAVDRSQRSGPPIVGWIGTQSNLPYLESERDALRDVARRHSYRLRVVTDAGPPRDEKGWAGIPLEWIAWNETIEIDELSRFDVGLMPLADDAWTRGKCGLKAIQYLATAAPAIVSPVGVNREIVVDGQSGFHATTPEEWCDRLERLLVEGALRRQHGAAGRRHVELNYSLDAHFERWKAALMGC